MIAVDERCKRMAILVGGRVIARAIAACSIRANCCLRGSAGDGRRAVRFGKRANKTCEVWVAAVFAMRRWPRHLWQWTCEGEGSVEHASVERCQRMLAT